MKKKSDVCVVCKKVNSKKSEILNFAAEKKITRNSFIMQSPSFKLIIYTRSTVVIVCCYCSTHNNKYGAIYNFFISFFCSCSFFSFSIANTRFLNLFLLFGVGQWYFLLTHFLFFFSFSSSLSFFAFDRKYRTKNHWPSSVS